MSQKPDAANCFSRRVREAVTPLNSEAFSYDARKLLHNSASVALHGGQSLLDEAITDAQPKAVSSVGEGIRNWEEGYIPPTVLYKADSNRFGMTEPYGTES